MSITLNPRAMHAKDVSAIEKFLRENPDKITKLPAGIAPGAVMSARAKADVKKKCSDSRLATARVSTVSEEEIPF